MMTLPAQLGVSFDPQFHADFSRSVPRVGRGEVLELDSAPIKTLGSGATRSVCRSSQEELCRGKERHEDTITAASWREEMVRPRPGGGPGESKSSRLIIAVQGLDGRRSPG